MKFKLAFAIGILILVPAAAAAQERILPVVPVLLDGAGVSILSSDEYFHRASPLSGVRVSVRIDPSRRGTVAVRDLRPRQATTDANGEFTFPDLAPGAYLLEFTQLSTIVGPASNYDRHGNVNITVTEAGLEWKNANAQSERTLDIGTVERTFLDGNASFGLSLPHLELTLDDAGRGSVLRGTITKELTGTLVLTAQKNVFHGTITSAPRSLTIDPIPGIDVVVRKNPGGVMFRTTTDADGVFVVANLAPGDYVLEITPVLVVPGTVIPIDVTDTEITLQGNVLQGKISEDQNPRPTDRAACTVTGRVTNAQGQPETACLADVLLSDGSTGQENVLAGRVTNETTGKDCTSPPRLTRRGEGSQALERGATVPGVDIVVRKKPGGEMLQTTTDADGAFSFANLAPGQYVLQFAQTGVTVNAGAASELQFEVIAPNDSPRSLNGATITYTGLEVAWHPYVELRMEATGQTLHGRITNDTVSSNCESVSRPRTR